MRLLQLSTVSAVTIYIRPNRMVKLKRIIKMEAALAIGMPSRNIPFYENEGKTK